ncbi:hypothetical protein BN2475_510056 [Paraburkholderia ribeironis]|uniref:Uncharacterized protein n=1 Tax=Paraburkholderia ribeironis TaxID=1247936 RepID=A0A1N7SCC9_9BURK|nr:hypothetical protein BN2475_510056 [Paraburkholderia ribeironis]
MVATKVVWPAAIVKGLLLSPITTSIEVRPTTGFSNQIDEPESDLHSPGDTTEDSDVTNPLATTPPSMCTTT